MWMVVVLCFSVLVGRCESDLIFSRVLIDDAALGCATNVPFEELQGTRCKIKCSLECQQKSRCVNFNYWEENHLCQLFDAYPITIQTMSSCINYDLFPYRAFAVPEINLATYKPTIQSSTRPQYYSSYAVDNDTTTDVNYCSHTDGPDSANNWFMVDLMGYFTLEFVQILTRDTTVEANTIRYKNLMIGVTNTSWLVKTPEKNTYPLCGVYPYQPVVASWIRIDCNPTIPSARFVIVHQANLNSQYGGYLSLCEIQVFGGKPPQAILVS